ncbi:S53 family peptidase [Alicyclobacillus vulcanalis]|uniref:Kumamolisin. Serine peptidase. MEROPS family S53 n=1 Tax=Alicyclobacillus vulcanalis TaxID=252246 RepID=A0A1N7N4V5_9BACL|nr:S53 family serine peptidase [Alicyclobacillus vulcanalis]SIS93199.1 kumamolisin. Serine peptidase. MEROPS family S53 [Alicyclobacillus vulcanalis]
MSDNERPWKQGDEKRVVLSGHRRPPHPQAIDRGPVTAGERVSVTVVLRRARDEELKSRVHSESQQRPHARHHLDREAFAEQHGASLDDFAELRRFADAHGLTLERTHQAAGLAVLSGSVDAVNQAFGVELRQFDHPGGSYRSYVGEVSLPASIASIVEAVLGLDTRPVARPHFRLRRAEPGEAEGFAARSQASSGAYTPLEVAQAYQFPEGLDGSGQCIAIIELGGGYDEQSLAEYFASLGVPAPQVVSVSVDGATNQPTGDPSGPDGEVELDIEVAGALAPGATLAVYFAPNTDAGFLDAITTAVHDPTHKPSIVSISWGGPEDSWSSASLSAMNRAFLDAAALGVTVLAAAGDSGSTDGEQDGLYHVDFPAASPYVLACGGTRLVANGGTLERETVWNDGADGGATGGGVSQVFPLPSWQEGANVPPSANPGGGSGRGVPDVAGNADPATGYEVVIDGQTTVIGGTSAVAPLFAALVARLNQKLGKPVGYLNPTLYALPQADVFHDITQGNNDIANQARIYQAGPGWDACTGLGSPIGVKLLQALAPQGATPEA